MNIELYHCNDAPIKVSKKLTDGAIFENCILKEETNMLTPNIIISGVKDIEHISKFNYVKIPKLNRYYFVLDMTYTNSRVSISCKVDPLYSFKDSILASKQVVSAERESGKMYLSDYEWKEDQRTYTRTKNIDTTDGYPFLVSDDKYVLVTI